MKNIIKDVIKVLYVDILFLKLFMKIIDFDVKNEKIYVLKIY